MKLSQLMDKDRLDLLIQEDLIRVKYSDDGEYRTLGYTDKAQYTKGSWDNPEVQICRGLIVDREDNVVARPYSKFFNYGQPEAYVDFDAPVEVTDKIDGSLGILFLDKAGELKVATRGSLNSDQALWATEWLRNNPDILDVAHPALPHTTILVEIVYPDNRIVLDYGGFEGLILLGSVHIDSGTYIGPQDTATMFKWRGDITTTFSYRTLNEALLAPPRRNAEGLVVRYLNVDKQVKIKQEDYVRLHSAIFHLSKRTIWEFRSENGMDADISTILEGLPDELHQWAKQVDNELVECYGSYVRQAREIFDEITNSGKAQLTRKEFYEKINGIPQPLFSLVFLMFDGKDISNMRMDPILKYLKPHYRGDDKAYFMPEGGE